MSKTSEIKTNSDAVRWYGPPSVALGAGLWGLESLFRVHLQSFFPSDLLVFFEHVLATLLLLPLAYVYRRQIIAITSRTMGWLLVSGVVGSAIGTILFTASLRHMNVSVATLLLNLQPVVAVFSAAILLKEKLGRGFLRWALIAMAAGAAITFDHLENMKISNTTGLWCIFGAIGCWGLSTVAGRAMMREITISVAAPLRFFIGSLATLAVALSTSGQAVLLEKLPLLKNVEVLQQYAFLLLVAGVTPTFFYFYGLKYTRATAAAFCEMLQAIVAVLSAWLILGDPLSPRQVVAGVVLLFAVVKINLIQAKKVGS